MTNLDFRGTYVYLIYILIVAIITGHIMFRNIYILEHINFSFKNRKSVLWLIFFVLFWSAVYFMYYISEVYIYTQNKKNNVSFSRNALLAILYIAATISALISIILIFTKTHAYVKVIGLGFIIFSVVLLTLKQIRNISYSNNYLWWFFVPYAITMLVYLTISAILVHKFLHGPRDPIHYEISSYYSNTRKFH